MFVCWKTDNASFSKDRPFPFVGKQTMSPSLRTDNVFFSEDNVCLSEDTQCLLVEGQTILLV